MMDSSCWRPCLAWAAVGFVCALGSWTIGCGGPDEFGTGDDDTADGAGDDDYLALAQTAAPYAAPITPAELAQQLEACFWGDVDVLVEPLAEEVLAAELITAMNGGFLLEGLDERPLTVTRIALEETASLVRSELLFVGYGEAATEEGIEGIEGILDFYDTVL